MKNLVVIASVLILLNSCCKEQIEEEPTIDFLIGEWVTQSVKEGTYRDLPKDEFRFIQDLEIEGEISFNEDFSGSTTGDLKDLTWNLEDFTWFRNDSLGRVFFVYGNYDFTYGELIHLDADSLIFDLRDYYVHPPYIGGAYFFRITLAKKEE